MHVYMFEGITIELSGGRITTQKLLNEPHTADHNSCKKPTGSPSA